MITYLQFDLPTYRDASHPKTCTGSKFDLMHFNGPQTKFIRDSLYKHPVYEGSKEWELLLAGTAPSIEQ